MSERLDELRRQRTLQREHLDWIDREIAALEAPSAPQGVLPIPGTGSPPVLAPASAADRDAEAILEEYRSPGVSIEKRTRAGCILYFAIALALMASVVAAAYLYSRSHRGS